MADRIVNSRYEEHDVYIGRPSIWGNPYSHLPYSMAPFKVATREEAVEKYEAWLRKQRVLLGNLPNLRGKVLGCPCGGSPCHGDVIIKLIEEFA